MAEPLTPVAPDPPPHGAALALLVHARGVRVVLHACLALLVLAHLPMVGGAAVPRWLGAAAALVATPLLFNAALAAGIRAAADPLRRARLWFAVETALVVAVLVSLPVEAEVLRFVLAGSVMCAVALGGPALLAWTLPGVGAALLAGVGTGALPPPAGSSGLLGLLADGALVALAGGIAGLGHQRSTRLHGMREEIRARAVEFERRAARLGRYLSPQVGHALSGTGMRRAVPQRKWLTVTFADIVGFTRSAERLEPEVLAARLTEYFDTLAAVALAHGGTLDKYIGDAVMVFHGDPDSAGRTADGCAAVRMALAMRDAAAALGARWQDGGEPWPLQVRVGVASGYCAVGDFGSTHRLDYTAIGRPANLAARIQAHAGAGQVLLCARTFALVRDQLPARRIGRARLKGIAAPIDVYEAGVAGPAPLDIRDAGFHLHVDPARVDGALAAARLRRIAASLARVAEPATVDLGAVDLDPGRR